jgi:hypothetical protein
LNDPVDVNSALFLLFNKPAFSANDALAAFDPLITPVTVIAPDELMLISVVEPLMNAMRSLLKSITFTKLDADLFLPIVVFYINIFIVI